MQPPAETATPHTPQVRCKAVPSRILSKTQSSFHPIYSRLTVTFTKSCLPSCSTAFLSPSVIGLYVTKNKPFSCVTLQDNPSFSPKATAVFLSPVEQWPKVTRYISLLFGQGCEFCFSPRNSAIPSYTAVPQIFQKSGLSILDASGT